VKIAYQALLAPQPDGGYTVTFPDLPDAITEGANQAEALLNATEVLTLALEGRVQELVAIPKPRRRSDRFLHPIIYRNSTNTEMN